MDQDVGDLRQVMIMHRASHTAVPSAQANEPPIWLASFRPVRKHPDCGESSPPRSRGLSLIPCLSTTLA